MGILIKKAENTKVFSESEIIGFKIGFFNGEAEQIYTEELELLTEMDSALEAAEIIKILFRNQVAQIFHDGIQPGRVCDDAQINRIFKSCLPDSFCSGQIQPEMGFLCHSRVGNGSI